MISSIIGMGVVAGGAGLAANTLSGYARLVGGTLIGFGLFICATPAWADETLVATDNSEINCTISKSGLTRISLKDDRFSSVSKMTTGVESEDFGVVNEPTRGDIYISIPDGYSRADVSFFGTSGKGFVYKFDCRVSGEKAQQVFVENRDIRKEALAEVALRASPTDTSLSLVQAMYSGQSLDGFEVRAPSLEAVMVGELKVQMITEYRGLDLTGRMLRIENRGKAAVQLDGQVIAPSNAVAVSVSQSALKPGEATTAFIVTPTGA